MSDKSKVYEGARFGRLTVVSFAGYRPRSDGRNLSWWLCRCDCGVEKWILSKSLKSGKTQSCGCLWSDGHRRGLNFKHGEAVVGNLSKEYTTWRNMVLRTTDPRSQDYKRYGGRGITLCDRWRDYRNFVADMGRCPTGMSLERKDNNGPYSPANCIWATLLTQANNTSRNRWIIVKGVRKTVAQWARLSGEHPASIYSRLKRGLQGLEAICGNGW